MDRIWTPTPDPYPAPRKSYPVCPPTGRIRFLALALAAAIALPAGLPVAPGGSEPARSARSALGLVAGPSGPSLKRPVADDLLGSSNRLGFAEESDEGDEGDDAKAFGPAVCVDAPGPRPSLVPLPLPADGPAPARPALPIGAAGRLRC